MASNYMEKIHCSVCVHVFNLAMFYCTLRQEVSFVYWQRLKGNSWYS